MGKRQADGKEAIPWSGKRPSQMSKRQLDGKEATMVRIEIARWERDKQMGRKLPWLGYR